MQRIIFILLAIALMSNTACSQQKTIDVPAAVMAAFNAKFPGINKVKWEMENEKEYEAEFKFNKQEMSANFDKEGNWLVTEIEIKINELPASVQATLKTDFTGFKIKKAYKLENADNGNRFEVEIEEGKESLEVLFTSDGKLISQEKIDEEND